jgi:hypothetical protein
LKMLNIGMTRSALPCAFRQASALAELNPRHTSGRMS